MCVATVSGVPWYPLSILVLEVGYDRESLLETRAERCRGHIIPEGFT